MSRTLKNTVFNTQYLVQHSWKWNIEHQLNLQCPWSVTFLKQIIPDIEIASCIQKGTDGIEGGLSCNFTLVISVKVK